ncbi:MAG: hypothetical protein RL030_2384, partial [Pseudomonadota bacterium]
HWAVLTVDFPTGTAIISHSTASGSTAHFAVDPTVAFSPVV